MKQKALLLLSALLAVSLSSCSDDDDDTNQGNVPVEVLNAFDAKYPGVSRIEWENKKGYSVAEFVRDNMETNAWFDAQGTWYMSETDLPFNSLPQPVKESFQASEYSSWKVDDVDMLERKDSETIYIIEVESGNKETDLYYSAEGILVKEIPDYDNDDYENHLPQPTPNEIASFINERYPDARIIEMDRENGHIEVDIIHDKKGKEVVFDLQSQWLYTSWEIRISALPQAVANITGNPSYTGYRIDEADYVETPQGDYYLLELEKGESELKIKVDENGNVLS